MPRRGDKPREPRPGVYRAWAAARNTRRVFTGLINNGWAIRRCRPAVPDAEAAGSPSKAEAASFSRLWTRSYLLSLCSVAGIFVGKGLPTYDRSTL